MSSMEQSLRKRIDQLQSDVKKLNEVVAFYGDHENHKRRAVTIQDGNRTICGFRSAVEMDGGELARKAKV